MYSDFFEMNAAAYYELYCAGTNNPEFTKYFRVKISIQEEIHYMEVAEIAQDSLTRLIKNSSNFPIEIRSASSKQESPQVVPAGCSLHYAQCYPQSSGSKLKVSLRNSKGNVFSTIIDLMVIQPDPETYDIGESDILLKSNVSFVGENTVLEIGSVRKGASRSFNTREDGFRNIIEYSISAVSVSFMRLPEKKDRQELLNLVLTNLTGLVQLTGGTQISFDGAVEDIQVDNNSVHNTNFPVVVKKGYNHSEQRDSPQAKKFCSWHVVLKNPAQSSHWYFSDIHVQFSKLELFVEEEYIDSLLSYKTSLLKAVQVETGLFIQDIIKYKYYTDFLEIPDSLDISKKVWKSTPLAPRNILVFLESIYVSPIEVELSYYQDAKSTVEKDFEMFSLIGVIIGGFEEAQISLKMISAE